MVDVPGYRLYQFASLVWWRSWDEIGEEFWKNPNDKNS